MSTYRCDWCQRRIEEYFRATHPRVCPAMVALFAGNDDYRSPPPLHDVEVDARWL